MAFIYIEITNTKGLADHGPKFLLTKDGAAWLAQNARVELGSECYVAVWEAENFVKSRMGVVKGYHYRCGADVCTVVDEGAWWSVGPMGAGKRTNYGRLVDAQAAALAKVIPTPKKSEGK